MSVIHRKAINAMKISVNNIETEEWVKMPFGTHFKPLSWFSQFWREWMGK